VIVDIIKNPHLAFEEIALRHYLLGGRNLLDTDRHKNVWMQEGSKQRLALLKSIYAKVRAQMKQPV
jgi:hypothetical protein